MQETTSARIYPLDHTVLTQEQMAVVFAMTSRSPDPFDQIAARVSAESAADFHEKWVLDYGHASVAEHAVLHLAIENISRLACDQLENNRLASYTEKSSRYQVIARDSYRVPDELRDRPGLRERYTETMDRLFGAYHSMLERCITALMETHPKAQDERKNAHELRIRRIATDACRGVLPAATLTNVGMTANARTMEHAISKLLSTELIETRELGSQLKEQGQNAVPTLIKYADRSPYLARAPMTSEMPVNLGQLDTPDGAALVRYKHDAPRDLATALLYRSGQGDYVHTLASVDQDHGQEIQEVIRQALEGMGPHDQPPREFETVHYTFEFTMDYGALREFRRHRMLTPLFQPLTVRHGVNVPSAVRDTGLEADFRAAAEDAEELFRTLEQEGPGIAQYAVTHAHLQKTLTDLNLRECYHLFRLRTSDRAHESIRGPMKQALRAAARVHPELFTPLTG